MPITEQNIQGGVAKFVGSNFSTKEHAHHALEIIISQNDTFDLITETVAYRAIPGIIIKPDVLHTFMGQRGTFEFIYLDPELSNIDDLIKDTFVEHQSTASLDILVIERIIPIIRHLFLADTNRSRAALDERVAHCLTSIEEALMGDRLSLAKLSEQVHLSKSRLSHLFKEQIGIPVQRYILWNRIKLSINAVVEGYNLTQAAHIGGFADSAHFNKKFQSMFGITPSAVLK